MKTRIPVDDNYALLVGKAIYIFAYYEWALIYLIQHYNPGFVQIYSRGSSMTSGSLKKHLKKIIDDPGTDFTIISKAELDECYNEFNALIHKRNALVHAHPCTAEDGSQILTYQSELSKPISDFLWLASEVESAIAEFDRIGSKAARLVTRLRSSLVGNTPIPTP